MSGVALVTGASRGVGRAIAASLAARGLDLGLVGRASPELSGAAEQLARELGRKVVLAPADFRDPASLERAAARVVEDLGPPSVVVHNAGMIVRGTIEQTSVDAWDEQLDVNLRAPFVLTRALLPPMRAAGRGRFVFIGSISGTLGSPGAAAYAASKWGLSGFVKSLAEELRDSGLLAVAILPGAIDTDMLRGGPFAARMSADEVAKTATFLALDASPAHNGALVEMFG